MSQEFLVAPEAEFGRGTRRLIKAGKRNIAVYNVRGQYFAIDNACYHHGGPLLDGNIEDLGGHMCVKCPWHSYRISLNTGEGLYWGLTMDAPGGPKNELKSKGPKQRTHKVSTRNGNVMVTLDLSQGDTWESDHYAEMALANQEEGGMKSSGGGGPKIHSGFAVDQNRSGALLAGNLGGQSIPSQIPPGTAVVITKVIDSSSDDLVKTFVFDRVGLSAAITKIQLIPGMWVKLKVPVPTPTDPKAEAIRQWTVTSVKGKVGGWFACTVKRRDDGEGGSLWLHKRAGVNKGQAEIIEVGGNFTLHHLRPKINALNGKAIFISGGIGITPLYASLKRFTDDPFATISGPPLHVVHLHSERRLSDVPFPTELFAWHKQWSTASIAQAPFSYQCRIISSLSEEDQKKCIKAPAAESLTPLTVGYGRRLGKEDIVAALKTLADETPKEQQAPKTFVMLCGPAQMMRDVARWCGELDIEANHIATEDF